MMPEASQSVLGLIELDAAPAEGDFLNSPARLSAAERLGTATPPVSISIERIVADVPRLASELRAELRKFLDRLADAKLER